MEIRYRIDPSVSPDALTKFSNMTFPPIDTKVRKGKIFDTVTGFIAAVEKNVVGLLLVDYPWEKGARIISAMVVKEYRNKGVMKRLLSMAESFLSEKGYTKIGAVMQSNWKKLNVAQRMLEQAGWEPPEEKMVMCKTSCRNYLKASWILLEMPPGYRVVTWNDAGEEIRNEVLSRKEEDWYPVELVPFQAEEIVEGDLSLFLLKGDKVIGWWISHVAGEKTLQRTAWFIDEKYRSLSLSLAFSAYGVRKQLESKYPDFIFQIAVKNKGMMSYFRRYLEMLQDEVVMVYESVKTLNP